MNYNPELSIKQNAINNGVSQSAVRGYIYRNGIDRKHDNKILLQRSIQNYQKQYPDASINVISKALGISYKTVHKHLKSNELDTSKLSALDTSKRKFVIQSISDNQDYILLAIMRLYNQNRPFECDITYNKGGFYKNVPQPLYKFDIQPLADEVLPLSDFYNSPDNTFNSIVVDLPFLVRPDAANWDAIMRQRFTAFNSVDELYQTNTQIITECYRLLKRGGILIIKTMDFTFAGQQFWISYFVQNKAFDVGYKLIDTFIYHTQNRVLSKRSTVQRHARKHHSYFFVFRK